MNYELTYDMLKEEMVQQLAVTPLSVYAERAIEDSINRGYQDFLVASDWTFTRGTDSQQLLVGDVFVDYPDDFALSQGEIMLDVDGYLQWRLTQVNEEEIEGLDENLGIYPRYYSLVQSGDDLVGASAKIRLYPAVTTANLGLHFGYRKMPDIPEGDKFFLGGPAFSGVIRASAYAAHEVYTGNTMGGHGRAYQQALEIAKRNDDDNKTKVTRRRGYYDYGTRNGRRNWCYCRVTKD